MRGSGPETEIEECRESAREVRAATWDVCRGRYRTIQSFAFASDDILPRIPDAHVGHSPDRADKASPRPFLSPDPRFVHSLSRTYLVQATTQAS